MENYLTVANSLVLWLSVIPIFIVMLTQIFLFTKKARNVGEAVELTPADSKRAFNIGMRTAVGPSMSVFVVMLGLIGVIGGPLAWQRLSIIGGASTELASATQAATAMDVTLGGEEYGITHFANAAWVMGLNGGAWLLFTALFTDKMGVMSDKVTKGNTKRLGLLSISAICGAFAYLLMNQIANAVASWGTNPNSYRVIVAAVAGSLTMFISVKLSKRFKFLSEFGLGFAMLVGMAAAVIF